MEVWFFGAIARRHSCPSSGGIIGGDPAVAGIDQVATARGWPTIPPPLGLPRLLLVDLFSESQRISRLESRYGIYDMETPRLNN